MPATLSPKGSPETPQEFGESSWPTGQAEIDDWTDKYFSRTKHAVAKFGDAKVTYALFMRRPVISAPRLALDWLQAVAEERGITFEIELKYKEGKWVGAGDPIAYVTGAFSQLVDLETLLLQKLGPACVAAYNAYSMCADLPNVAFMAILNTDCL